MSIYCSICNENFSSYGKLSKHIRDHHKISSKEYYDKYCYKQGDGECVICGKETTWENINVGYKPTCSKSCGLKYSRARLKADPEKFDSFRKRVAKNQADIWKEREVTGEKKRIFKKVSSTNIEKNAALTPDERMKRYSRYYTMSDEAIEALNEKGARQLVALGSKTGYHKCVSGYFKPINRKKYLGNVRNIYYRSSYEIKFMKWLDKNDHVKGWLSEEVVIPYMSPLDRRAHRYFPDFYVEIYNKDGKLEKWIVEIKPSSQTTPPKSRKRKTKKFIQEVATWGVNEAKWEAAEAFCKKRGMKFEIITEKDLNVKY
jgi:hypothetical protein